MLGNKIKELRENKRLTQKQLAETIGVGQSTIGMIESGKNKGSSDTLLKLANFFDVSLDYLLSSEDQLNLSIDSLKNIHSLAEDGLKESNKQVKKINESVKKNKIDTIAAHFEDEYFSDDDVEDIENFIEFILSKQKK